MDTITQEDYSPNTGGELTSPFPPKRPRTDCTHNIDGKTSFAFPELVTYWKTIGSSSSTSTWRGNAGLVCVAEGGDMEDGKTHEQPQDAQFIVIPITSTTSYTGLSDVSLISAEKCFKLLVRDEQLPIAPTDKLTSIVLDDEDRALAETCTLKECNADTFRPPDSKLQGKALEDEAHGNNKAGALVQNSASQIQGLQVSAREYGLSYQSGCTSENPLHDTQGQSAEAEESNQEWQEPGLRETILFSEEEDNSLISFTHADTDSFFSDPQPSGNPAQIGENVAICNPETKDENGISMNSIPSAALCAEGSIVSYGVVSVDVPIETVSLDADDFCGAKGEDAAGKMIAQAQSKTSDHTTGTPMLAQIHQGPAEGDNDASPFTVIEPAIWSETDGEAKEKSCNSGSALAGVQLLSPVCNMETPLPCCSDIRLSQEVLTRNQNGKSDHQRCTQQGNDGKEDLWQSFTEPPACTINNSGSDDSCHWKTSPSSQPAKPLPPGDGRQVSHDQLKDHIKTKENRPGN
ncbi:uncharacterized protein LOC134107855 [Pungitius pungitius]|uniref:uncharacterized protein LOC134107855 n=1 Tax=Pungitius pungitius TaxID=134920 RepID=UPI002E0EF416